MFLWLILLILLYILVIDLNGTLLDINYANLISYKDVLSNKFNRVAIKILNNYLENPLSAVELLKIKEYKDQIYSKYLNLTKVNYLLYYLILELHKTNRIILLTNTNKNRADELIKFFMIYKIIFLISIITLSKISIII